MNLRFFASRISILTLFVTLQSCASSSHTTMPANGAPIPSSAIRELLSPHRTPAAIKGARCSKGSLPPAAARKKPLVYVATSGILSCILIYRPRIKAPIGQITDSVAYPNGVFVDGNGNLYVANGDNGSSGTANTTVTMYAPGKLKPSRTYAGLSLPESVAVGTDGTVYIADALGNPSGGGIVREYPSGSTTSTTSLTLPGAYAMGVTLDATNNLYVSWWTQATSQIQVYKYAPGSAGGTNLNLDLPTNTVPAHTLAFDGAGKLVIPVETGYLELNEPQYLAVFAPGSTKPHKIWLGSLANLVFGLAFSRSNPHLIYLTGENSNNLLLLTYPGAQVRAGAAVGGAAGVAVSPGT